MPSISRGSPPASPGSSSTGAALERFAVMAGRSGHPVLVTGETGCGKTYLARRIHGRGGRSSRPFVRVNCATIPESLFERELFGHVRGAFTGAGGDAPGFVEIANGGTLFLDEIGELPLHLQAKLLTVLEDGTFRRIGSTREQSVDLHLVSATNRDLDEMVAERQFRRDLFYRISVLRYTVAPLRERRDEFPGLVEGILAAASPGAETPGVSDAAMEVLARHPWPGNIRELENVLRAALVFSRGGTILPEHLPAEVRFPRSRRAAVAAAGDDASVRYEAPDDAETEREAIEHALVAADGNRTRAARRLGMARSTLWVKMQRYRIDPSALVADG